MEVRAGYKLTEVGLIPEDWEVAKIGELIESRSILGHLDGNHGELYPRSHDFKSYGVPYIGANDFQEGCVTFERCKFLSDEKAAMFRKGIARDGDVLFAHNATVGPVALLRTIFSFVILSTTATYFRCNPDRLDNSYIKGALQSKQFVKQYQAVMAQSTRFQVPITAQRKLTLVVPPLPEKRAIAAALNDVDALLAGLDRLIAKKRDLKQAAMQQLLTGQTRLPGFQGEWAVKRLEEHVSFLRNGVNSRAELTANGLIKYLHYGDIHASAKVTLDPSAMPSLSQERAHTLDRLKDGDLVFVDASEDLDGVGKSVEVVGATGIQFVAGLHTIAARFDKTVLADGFKAYLQFCPPFRQHLKRLAAGTKVYATNRRHIASVEMRLPAAEEQTAIAAVLSDMDAELTALEARRAKTRALKQAMMQELLTGRTRLL